MIRKRFQCRNCGERFEADTFEKGEAKEKRVPTGPVRCPNCRSDNVVEVG